MEALTNLNEFTNDEGERPTRWNWTHRFSQGAAIELGRLLRMAMSKLRDIKVNSNRYVEALSGSCKEARDAINSLLDMIVLANSPAAKAGTLVQQVTQADEVGCSMDIFDRASAGQFGRPLRYDSSTESLPPISDQIFRTPSGTQHGQILQTPTASPQEDILTTPSTTHPDEILSTPPKLHTPASSLSQELSSSEDLGQSEAPTHTKILTRGSFCFVMPGSVIAARLARPDKKIAVDRGTSSQKKQKPVRKTDNATKSSPVEKRMDVAENDPRISFMRYEWINAFVGAKKRRMSTGQARFVALAAWNAAGRTWDDALE
mgnify:CR=1 FL=1